jgi:hypothetical protein
LIVKAKGIGQRGRADEDEDEANFPGDSRFPGWLGGEAPRR